MLSAVIRESTFSSSLELVTTREFKDFQEIHAHQSGYRGSVVTHVGGGRHIFITLWGSEKEMHAAREALEPIVERLLNPLMTTPSELLGTGTVRYSDIEFE